MNLLTGIDLTGIEVRDFADAAKPRPQAVAENTIVWEPLPSPETSSESTESTQRSTAEMYADNRSTDQIIPAPPEWPLVQNSARHIRSESRDKLISRQHRGLTQEEEVLFGNKKQEKQGPPSKQLPKQFRAKNPLSPFARVVSSERIGVTEGRERLPETIVQLQHRKPVASTNEWQHALKAVARFFCCTP